MDSVANENSTTSAPEHSRIRNYISVNMYYDSYENYYGDGFYPYTERKKPCCSEIELTFIIDDSKHWKQVIDNNPNICGLDGDEGEYLLKKLNEAVFERNKKAEILLNIGVGIKNKYGTIIHPK